jgi:hypothetical protein
MVSSLSGSVRRVRDVFDRCPEKACSGSVVVLAVEDLLEAADGVLELDVLALAR